MSTFKIEGLDKLATRLDKLAQGIGPAFAHALNVEAEIEMTEMKRRTPVDTGNLRASGHVVSKWSGREFSTMWVFGGPAAPYAAYVHENLEAFHPIGEAKFVERVLLESVPHLAKRIAARASDELVGA